MYEKIVEVCKRLFGKPCEILFTRKSWTSEWRMISRWTGNSFPCFWVWKVLLEPKCTYGVGVCGVWLPLTDAKQSFVLIKYVNCTGPFRSNWKSTCHSASPSWWVILERCYAVVTELRKYLNLKSRMLHQRWLMYFEFFKCALCLSMGFFKVLCNVIDCFGRFHKSRDELFFHRKF